ncbi:hypothetical protein DHEL01_v208303 [Diaporthe helianthi]|uniref:Uncharacterized protein n=1 Tax=Diaporthe helianthi TaxID=158607 RepID=A0A2P5HST6_DIAHE|nr:hypothetical protein DHEL01_v208303 [Diaporthe helianthi]
MKSTQAENSARTAAASTTAAHVPAENTTAQAVVGWDNGPSRRGTLRLLWSCVATMFTCTWTVLHMNVPDYQDTVAQRMARKVKWLVINILFPEFIFSKAVCDLRLALDELRSFELASLSPFSAIKQPSFATDQPTDCDSKHRNSDGDCKNAAPRSEADEHGSSEESLIKDNTGHSELQNPYWTVVHSYYAQMGGILCLHKQAGCQTLNGCFPFASPAMIWAFDWADDRHPLKEFALREADIQDRSKADWLAKGISILQITWLIINVTVRGFTGLPVTQLEISAFAFSVMAIGIYMANWWKPKDVLRPSVQSATFNSYQMRDTSTTPFVQSFSEGLYWLRSTRRVNPVPKTFWDWNFATASRVENDLVWMDGEPPYFFIMVGLSSLAFGGMHCIAWNFDFPSQAEVLCWRIASLVSAILPITVLFLSYGLDYISVKYGKVQWNKKSVTERCEDTARILANTSSMAYMGARMTVIVLLFTCMRAVPSGVYTITPWTRFLPKIS